MHNRKIILLFPNQTYVVGAQKNRLIETVLLRTQTVTPKLANSEDPEEMPHYEAFHQGLHCLLRQKKSSEKEIHFHLDIITCDPSIYTLDHPKFIVSNQKEESIRVYRVKKYPYLDL